MHTISTRMGTNPGFNHMMGNDRGLTINEKTPPYAINSGKKNCHSIAALKKWQESENAGMENKDVKVAVPPPPTGQPLPDEGYYEKPKETFKRWSEGSYERDGDQCTIKAPCSNFVDIAAIIIGIFALILLCFSVWKYLKKTKKETKHYYKHYVPPALLPMETMSGGGCSVGADYKDSLDEETQLSEMEIV